MSYHKSTDKILTKLGGVKKATKLELINDFDKEIRKISHNRETMKILAIFGLLFIVVMFFAIILIVFNWK